MNFSEQIQLHRQRRFEEETARWDGAINLRLKVLETVVEATREGVVITDADTLEDGPRIQYLNAAYTEASGYAADQLVGRPFFDLWNHCENGAALEQLKQAYQSRQSAEVELEGKRADGSSFWIELRVSPLTGDDGACHHWIHIQRDIQDRHSYTQAIQRARRAEEQNEKLLVELMKHKETEAKLLHNAIYDSLTGLKNRTYFLDRVTQSLNHVRSRSEYRCSLLYLDLDGFKQANDSHGHHFGDKMLMEFARRLENCCRPQDSVCRIGGDEFTILLDDLKSAGQAVMVAERILQKMKEPVTIEGTEITFRTSIGICELEKKFTAAEEAIREADMAMYRAKRGGGGNFAIAGSSGEITAFNLPENLALGEISALAAAVEEGDLELLYQPIVNPRSLKVCLVETLVRWKHPKRGLLLPNQFLSLAQQTGLIVQLGRLVLQASCLQLNEWQRFIEFRETVISINVSMQEFADPHFLENVVDILADTGTTPWSIQFEIQPETLTVPNAEDILLHLRKIGIRIAFSQGADGQDLFDLAQKYLPNMLKLNAQKSIPKYRQVAPPSALLSVRGPVCPLAVCMEKVELPEQHHALLVQGIAYAQGNFYCPPLPGADVLHVLTKGIRLPASALRTSA